ncbi:putative HTH-type transcriptional regulator YidP [Roseivivax jejudonensis]|uniref:Putative HTH-type transcriptional regulator YidP n=1 Tax=Roseivivax jejudonensis TaxID=1529041 RepID=A0A1X6ZXR4_9RHOB|nr:GntR family transcriptional regulator [Roseivivax jejudonensis]SLN64745.1 putative HTH-type transcriptional regulator YidP [Roseivivax jejudonensis]
MRDHVRPSQTARQPEGGKARRVYLVLRDDIVSGLRANGSLLPGEQRLAETFAVSRVTVRRALDALEGDGLIERRAGSGTRVCAAPDGAAMAADMTTLIPQLVAMGRHSARLLSFSYGAAPDAVARAMGLDPGARVQTAVRVRLAEGEPFSHLTTHVPEDIASNYSEADLAGTPLYQLLERSGVRVDAAEQSISAALAAPDVAEALDVATGAALLSIRRVVRDAAGRGVEHLSALYRPDRFRLEMALTRVGEGGARHWEPVVGDGAGDGGGEGEA